MSQEVFRTVKVGDTVHYLTPQGQNGKGKVVIHSGEHVVVNRGKGQPQVVTDKNYSHHTRGGKVIGALLSNYAQHGSNERKAKKAAAALKATNAASPYKIGDAQMNASKAFGWTKTNEATWQGAGDPYNWDPVARAQAFAAERKKVGKPTGPKDLGTYKSNYKGPPPRAGTKTLPGNARAIPEDAKPVNEVSKALAKRYVIAAVKDVNYSEKEAEGARTKEYADTMYNKAVKRSAAITKHPKAMDAYKKHVWGKNIYKEDASDAEGKSSRVAKTKKKEKAKKLHELNTGTLASYVTKAIADRKKQQGMADMARRIHTPERSAYFVDKANAKADKRSKGIKLGVAKIAKAYEETEVNEAKKAKTPKPVNWQSIRTHNYSVLKSTEGGQPLKHHIMRLAAAGIPARKGHSPYVGHTALEIPAKHERKASKILYGESVYIDEQPINEVSAPGQEAWIKANKQRFIAQYGKEKGTKILYAKAWKMSKQNEARESEWTANQHLAATSSKPAKGHYLMRDGRRLSGPHSPEEAVKQYKGMSDSKGVKIVHVKEAAEGKAKKAAQKAIKLAKDAKKGKVDTKPTLDVADKGSGGPINGTLETPEGQKC